MLLNKDQIKQDARWRWKPEIIPSLTGIGDEWLTNKHKPCPLCRAGKDRFRFDDRDGHGGFYCSVCGPGDGFTFVSRANGWTFAEVLRAVAKLLGVDEHQNYPHRRTVMPVSLVKEVNKMAYDAICEVWINSVEISDHDLAAAYIRNSRSIPVSGFPPVLRFGQATRVDSYSSQTIPALLAAFTNQKGELVQVQRIFLTAGGKKHPMKHPKRFLGRWMDGAMTGGAIKLYEPTDTLAICEGVETGLAFHALYGVPVWATTGKAFLEQVEIPDSVSNIIIAADNDTAGITSAKLLRSRLHKEGRSSDICMPHVHGWDFADLCKHEASIK